MSEEYVPEVPTAAAGKTPQKVHDTGAREGSAKSKLSSKGKVFWPVAASTASALRHDRFAKN